MPAPGKPLRQGRGHRVDRRHGPRRARRLPIQYAALERPDAAHAADGLRERPARGPTVSLPLSRFACGDDVPATEHGISARRGEPAHGASPLLERRRHHGEAIRLDLDHRGEAGDRDDSRRQHPLSCAVPARPGRYGGDRREQHVDAARSGVQHLRIVELNRVLWGRTFRHAQTGRLSTRSRIRKPSSRRSRRTTRPSRSVWVKTSPGTAPTRARAWRRAMGSACIRDSISPPIRRPPIGPSTRFPPDPAQPPSPRRRQRTLAVWPSAGLRASARRL